jgi:hypothetical protein
MRTRKLAVFSLMMLATVWFASRFDVAAAADDPYVGTWKGSWEGGGASGRFDLTFTRGSDGKLAGSVSVGTDMGDYNATFSSVAIAADKLTGAYDYPPDPQGEVTLAGSFESKNAAGTWSLGAKGQAGQQAITGTWKVSKQ